MATPMRKACPASGNTVSENECVGGGGAGGMRGGEEWREGVWRCGRGVALAPAES